MMWLHGVLAVLVAAPPAGLAGPPPPVLGDKTLVAWVYAASVGQRGADVLSVFEPADETFDAIVLGEKTTGLRARSAPRRGTGSSWPARPISPASCRPRAACSSTTTRLRVTAPCISLP